MMMFSKKVFQIGFLALCLTAAACSSGSGSGSNDSSNNNNNSPNGSDSPGDGTSGDNLQVTTTSALSLASTAVTQAITSHVNGGGAFLKTATVNSPCTTGGPADVSGTVGANSFALTLDLDGCNDLTGTLELTGDYTFASATDMHFGIGFNGNVSGNGCDVNFGDLDYNFGNTTDGITANINGSINSGCGDTTFDCNFIDTDLLDAASLENVECVES